MADKKQEQEAVKQSAERQGAATPNDESNSGTADPAALAGADGGLAEAADLTEGEVKALRDDAGLNQSAGHNATVGAWEASPAGQEFIDGEKDREKKYKDEAKQYDEQTNKEGLTEAEAKYVEAVEKARKG